MVSFVLPVYNVAEFLPACLDSLLAQTVSDWEAILIDDGSCDPSGAICDGYVRRDGRFIAIHQKNSGASAARNAGLCNARGEYVAFLDADDRLAPDFLEKLLRPMEAGADLACCEYRRILSDGSAYVDGADDHIGEYLLDADLPCAAEQGWERYASSDRILAAFWEAGILNSIWGKLYRRSVIEANALRFDTTLRFAEDMRFATAYALRAADLALVDQPLYLYLWREGSLTTAPRPGMLADRYRGLTAISEAFALEGHLAAARSVRDTLDFLTPEPFLERMDSRSHRKALLKEYCALPNYSRMMQTVRATRSRLTATVYALRSPLLLRWYLYWVQKRRG